MSKAQEIKVGDYLCFYDGAFVYECDIEKIHKMYPKHDNRDPWIATVTDIPRDLGSRFVSVNFGVGQSFLLRVSEVYK